MALGFVSTANASLSVTPPDTLIANLQGPVLQINPASAPRTSERQPTTHRAEGRHG